jgi:hypothetical protein
LKIQTQELMKMATKHTATFQAHTFTRTTQHRVYTHMVVGLVNIEADRAATEAWARKEYAMNLSYYQQMAKGGEYVGTFADGRTFTKPITDMERDSARATITAGVDGAIADRLRELDKRTANAWKTADGLSTVYSAGWTSRLDLAVKLAARTPGGVIVEAVRK